MSRSNPHEGTPNPSTRWFEWSGETGTVRYYDKDKKENVDVGSDFTFILLDQLGCVRGWHDESQSGIYSNEVKDTRQEVLIVKAFKGGVLAEGIYQDIKDKVNNQGGRFNANCYVAFKNGGGELSLGSLRFKGAALGAWMEFSKANRGELYKKAVRIVGYDEGKKGRVTFRIPRLRLVEIAKDTNDQAIGIDVLLQDYLTGYLKRTKREQVESSARHVSDEQIASELEPPPLSDDDIPF